MIEVVALTKVYNTGKDVSCRALDNVSFVLPDSGMVFVVGKSGCGKSTLLNLLGGLDKQTSGDVVVDGTAFSSFTQRQLDCYHNDYLGFVFQDYYLIDSLTVRQNVALALQLQGDNGQDAVVEALRSVDMEQFADRYPKQLSGGQCQRVAIARAIVKKPKLVLADEPTGNLDSRSGKHILELLKEYSKQNLVLVVSHNREDAETYADRIIELHDGRIASDVERNVLSQELTVTDSEIVMQKGIQLDETQLERVNKRLQEGKPLTLRQVDNKFVPTQTVATTASRQANFADKRLTGKGACTLFSMFTRKQLVNLLVTLVLVICLVTVLGISQMFLQFDTEEETLALISKTENKQFAMRKGYEVSGTASKLGFYRCKEVTDSDEQAFRDAGYDGKMYKLYNVSLVTAQSDYTLEKYQLMYETQNYSSFFAKTGNGVLVCDLDYLASVYGEEGKLDVLSGDIESEGVLHGVDLVITDYFADSILKHTSSLVTLSDDIYSALTDGKAKFSRYKVGAVINTHYKERYAQLISQISDGASLDSLQNDPMYLELLNELNLTLNIAYSLNPDFESAMADYSQTSYCHFSYLRNPTTTFDDVSYESGTFYCTIDNSLKAGQVKLCKSIWRSVTKFNKSNDDTAYWNSLKGKTITFAVHDDSGKELGSVQLEIVGFVDREGMRVSADTIRELRKYDTVPFALYFDDVSQISTIYTAGEKMNYFVPSNQFMAVQSIAGVVEVFKDFFEMIVAVLYVACTLLLVFFGVRSIRKNIFEIGVLRALGAKTHNLALIFALQMIMLGVIICIVSLVGMYFGVRFGNAVLVKGFVAYSENPLAGATTIIRYRTTTAVVGATLVLALSVLASVVPVVSLRKVKPRQIIVSQD